MTERRVTGPPSDDDGHRRAVVRTIVILAIVLGLAFAFAMAMTRRLISTWQPEPTAATTTVP